MDATNLNQDEDRKVPRNLIPVVTSKINTEWSKSTIQYAFLFSPVFGYTDANDIGTVNDWMRLGKRLQSNLQHIGCTEYLKHMKDYFRRENIWVTKNDCKKPPNSIDDITSIICAKEWYNCDIKKSRRILFYMMYDIFRKGNNQWLENASREWANHKNIVVDQSISTCKKNCRIGKDFIYSNMLNGISQTIVRKWKYHTKTSHGEFLLNRKKDLKTNKYDKYECIPYGMEEGRTCYLYTLKGNSKEKLLRNLEYWFRECLINNIETTEIEKRLETCLNETHIKDCVLTQDELILGKKLVYCILF